jgi:hypothetical protein
MTPKFIRECAKYFFCERKAYSLGIKCVGGILEPCQDTPRIFCCNNAKLFSSPNNEEYYYNFLQKNTVEENPFEALRIN